MRATIFSLVVALVVVVLVLRLLRSRQLREKYAVLWIVVGTSTVVLAIFPGLLQAVSGALGFAVPSNLLFLLGILLLLGVALHLSLELSILEDETRVLAEESAIARLAQERLAERVAALERVGASDGEHVADERSQATELARAQRPWEGEPRVRP